jgi:hypothetical protein
MTMVLLTVVGIVIAGVLTGAFPAMGTAARRLRWGQSMIERRPTPWRPSPPPASTGHGYRDTRSRSRARR